MPANERAVDSHKIDISDVVHELEELNLTMGRALVTDNLLRSDI